VFGRFGKFDDPIWGALRLATQADAAKRISPGRLQLRSRPPLPTSCDQRLCSAPECKLEPIALD
jgi:hypothetical protein